MNYISIESVNGERHSVQIYLDFRSAHCIKEGFFSSVAAFVYSTRYVKLFHKN